MINIFLKSSEGVATLVIAIILLVTTTLIVIFAANTGLIQQKIGTNQYQNQIAFEAASAGMEAAIPYLNSNKTAIRASATGGLINYTDNNIQNKSLSNGSRYTVTYTNPTVNNYDLLRISVTGVDTSTQVNKVITQLMQYKSLFQHPPTLPTTVKGDLSMSGDATISNYESNSTVQAGGQVNIGGNAGTNTTQGGSNNRTQGADIQDEITSLASTSETDLFTTYFGSSPSVIKSSINYYYSNNSDTNYSSILNGKTGTSIWIDQTNGKATLSGNNIIGSASNPVLLIVNGELQLSGNFIFYGMIYVLGNKEVKISGNNIILGGIITNDDLNISGSSSNIVYSSAVLTNTQNMMSQYIKILGSWKDF